MTHRETIELFKRLEHGDTEARDLLIEKSEKLVREIAKKQATPYVDEEDLVQEGYIGLIKAIGKFNWRKGFKFNTYAKWWILRYMQLYIQSKGRTIKIPHNIHQDIKKYQKARIEMRRKLNREPTDLEVDKITRLDSKEMESFYMPVNSLDVHLNSNTSDTFAEFVIYEDNFEQAIEGQLLNKAILDVLSAFGKVERAVILNRFGIDTEKKSLGEVSKMLSITRERVRQIEQDTLMRLKNTKLKHFTN